MRFGASRFLSLESEYEIRALYLIVPILTCLLSACSHQASRLYENLSGIRADRIEKDIADIKYILCRQESFSNDSICRSINSSALLKLDGREYLVLGKLRRNEQSATKPSLTFIKENGEERKLATPLSSNPWQSNYGEFLMPSTGIFDKNGNKVSEKEAEHILRKMEKTPKASVTIWP